MFAATIFFHSGLEVVNSLMSEHSLNNDPDVYLGINVSKTKHDVGREFVNNNRKNCEIINIVVLFQIEAMCRLKR